MISNPIQFAVVREDPRLTAEVISMRPTQIRKVLLIGSGGCNLLNLSSLYPELALTALDKNPAQLELVKRKISALQHSDFNATFNIGYPLETGLSECGNFESLFRGFRTFIHDLVSPYSDIKQAFENRTISGEAVTKLFKQKFWPVAFDLFFSDSILNAMFGPDATQYAENGSYPGYFRNVLEQGLLRPDSHSNYFLHHIFLGHYIESKDQWPIYLQKPPTDPKITFIEGGIEDDSVDISAFDLIDLSNLFDWMPPQRVEQVAQMVAADMKPGALLIYRQLNNHRDLKPLFRSLTFDETLETSLLEKDRSLFYCKIQVGEKLCTS